MAAAELRPFPFPHNALLAICSDLDETPDRTRYLDIARFLNTTAQTPAGRGVGLEVGNTIYFDMPGNQFAYWNTDDAGREMVRDLIRSGHIDCFHSFGDLATSRQHAQKSLEDLEKHGCKIPCWIDHSVAPTNFGSDIMKGSGDVQGAAAYHADLTYAHGVRFVWRGRVTSVIGQNRRRSLRGLFRVRHPLASGRTAGLEAAKGMLARTGDAKYSMHAKNALLRPTTLRDGRAVFEFMRCNPHWGGVSAGDTGDGLGDVLTRAFLQRLVARRGACVLYTHLGKTRHPDTLFSENTIAALRQLAEFARDNGLLVTTTRRALSFCAANELLAAKTVRDEARDSIHIDTSALRERNLPRDLSGVTVYTENPRSARVFVDGTEVSDLQRNPADEDGRGSVSIPWRPLAFPR